MSSTSIQSNTMSSSKPPREKSHNTWAAASSQSSQSIIDSASSSPPVERRHSTAVTTDDSGSHSFTGIPAFPRRSSFNYAHDSAGFSSVGNIASASKEGIQLQGERTFRKHERTRTNSFSREDQKRMLHGVMMTTKEGEEGYSSN